MDVQVRPLAARSEARPRRVQGLILREDLDPAVRRVPDDLAPAARNQDSLPYESRLSVGAVSFGSNSVDSGTATPATSRDPVFSVAAVEPLEPAEELAQQVVERALLTAWQCGEEGLLGLEMRFQRSVDAHLSSGRQPNEDAAAVCRIASALNESGVGEAIESFRHPGRGKHRRPHQVGGVQLVRLTGTTQGGEEVEPPRPEVVCGERLLQGGVCELHRAEQAADEAQRFHVQVRALTAPAMKDVVDVVRLG